MACDLVATKIALAHEMSRKSWQHFRPLCDHITSVKLSLLHVFLAKLQSHFLTCPAFFSGKTHYSASVFCATITFLVLLPSVTETKLRTHISQTQFNIFYLIKFEKRKISDTPHFINLWDEYISVVIKDSWNHSCNVCFIIHNILQKHGKWSLNAKFGLPITSNK